MRIGAFMYNYLLSTPAPMQVFFGQVGHRIGGLVAIVRGIS